MGIPAAERVLARIDITEPGCWVWPGAKTPNGYGTVHKDAPERGVLLVHRVLYVYFIGEIPKGLELDHLCRVRLCCNPVHLEPVTRRENVRRGAKMRGDRCPQGHAYPENWRVRANGYGYCIVCDYARTVAYRARKRLERDADRAGASAA